MPSEETALHEWRERRSNPVIRPTTSSAPSVTPVHPVRLRRSRRGRPAMAASPRAVMLLHSVRLRRITLESLESAASPSSVMPVHPVSVSLVSEVSPPTLASPASVASRSEERFSRFMWRRLARRPRPSSPILLHREMSRLARCCQAPSTSSPVSPKLTQPIRLTFWSAESGASARSPCPVRRTQYFMLRSVSPVSTPRCRTPVSVISSSPARLRVCSPRSPASTPTDPSVTACLHHLRLRVVRAVKAPTERRPASDTLSQLLMFRYRSPGPAPLPAAARPRSQKPSQLATSRLVREVSNSRASYPPLASIPSHPSRSMALSRGSPARRPSPTPVICSTRSRSRRVRLLSRPMASMPLSVSVLNSLRSRVASCRSPPSASSSDSGTPETRLRSSVCRWGKRPTTPSSAPARTWPESLRLPISLSTAPLHPLQTRRALAKSSGAKSIDTR
mmetsp:Transcript_11742/g.37322  ORF Transcript_11742/g.37322 Transcript_11742/m.37322 type:complete len:449 (+) Transcript_11742:386-1732(+)